jgi:hypothetical protein
VVFHGHPLGHYYCAHGNVHKEYSHHKSEWISPVTGTITPRTNKGGAKV